MKALAAVPASVMTRAGAEISCAFFFCVWFFYFFGELFFFFFLFLLFSSILFLLPQDTVVRLSCSSGYISFFTTRRGVVTRKEG